MQYPEYKWVDTAIGGPQRRNNVQTMDKLSASMRTTAADCYATWHRFPQTYALHCQQTGSTGGYRGPSYADFLPFDFDGADLPAVHDRVRDFLKMLEVSYELDGLHGVRCYFSGCKGFHVLLSSTLFGGWAPSPDLPRSLKDVVVKIADGIEIDTAIYDQNRLLRLPNTRHSRSNLFKIPLEPYEILTQPTEEILQQASSGPREVAWPEWDDCQMAPSCQALFKQAAKLVSKTTVKIPKPKVEDLFPLGLRDGEGRDNAAFAIACHLRDKRLSADMTQRILELWDAQQTDRLGIRTLSAKVTSAFRHHRPEIDVDLTAADIYTPAELVDAYTGYIEKLKDNKIVLGLPDVDARMRGIAPGEVLTVIAKSGVGKTAFLQNILRNIALSQDATSLFCSLEQPLAQVFERFGQLAYGQAGEDIERRWDDQEARGRIAEAVQNDLGRQVLTCGRSLKFSQLEHALDIAEDKIGAPVQLLAIDYLGLLDSSELDASLYGQVSRAAREIKSLAKRRDIAVICLCQVSRANGEDGSKSLNIYSARESGAIEESADFLLGLYRPDLHGADDRIAVQILKNRKGQHGVEFVYDFDKLSLRIAGPQVKLVQGELDVQRREY